MVFVYVEKGVEEGVLLVYGGKCLVEGNLVDGFYMEFIIFENVISGMIIV